MRNRIITLAALAALATAPGLASAANPPEGKRTTDIGIVVGGVLGAIVGGPPGAIAGMTLGGITAEREVEARRNGELEGQLTALAAEQRELSGERARLQARITELDRELGQERRMAAARPDVAALADGLAFSVGFRTNSAQPPDQAVDSLEALALLLSAVPSLEVRIDGYADPRGTEVLNRSLSEARATAIRDQLLAAGIPADRISIAGHGAPQLDPAAAPADPDGWALQRRADIRLEHKDERVVARP
ncbi:OmpA family protein [Thioalkalivibrio sp. XN279]|uniref:OmpA family protein n=1 Tax=Thioalkalivibrio sp. XN279 TaxID=2714953 RepID=UPI00140D987A|nr:OmpA family protein [Thioalkalivibrio sp. XN279]NHA14977.1 OmpA family protein [Thioalkalivibrio sp. XN279]